MRTAFKRNAVTGFEDSSVQKSKASVYTHLMIFGEFGITLLMIFCEAGKYPYYQE